MDFRYVIKDSDNTIKIVEDNIIFYNFDKIYLHDFDNSIEDLYYDILYDNEIAKNGIYGRNDFNKKYIKNSFELWEKLGITLHDINIFKRFVNLEKLKDVDDEFFNKYVVKSPKYLPIVYDSRLFNDSNVLFQEIYNDDDKTKNEIVFKHIIMPKVNKVFASTTYAHELSHTQLLTENGGTNNYFNEETIPMLMEFIFAANLDNSDLSFYKVCCQRLLAICRSINRLQNDLTYEQRVETEKYIISGIQAINLANTYFLSKNRIKKEMQEDVCKTFEGEKVTEDLLNKYESNYDEVDKNIKSLKRV